VNGEGRPARRPPNITNSAPRSLQRGRDGELEALVGQAWELRGTGYIYDAVDAILDWHDRRALRDLERRQARDARVGRLVGFLRATDPRHIEQRRAA